MDRNAEMKWYMDQFSGSRERFYEIHMQMCRKVDTISERTDCRGASCKAGNRICRADSKLDSICFAIKQKSQLHNRSGRRSAAAFFCMLQKKRIAALFYK